jgi:CheY-like chemotaxis protein
MIKNFIVVDDDPFNNILCEMTIELALGKVDFSAFTKPAEGLAYIQLTYRKEIEPTILLLDINMPIMSGWEFMEEFEKHPDIVKKQLTVYIVSSSVDPRDKEKAAGNKNIKGFISKPVDVEMIQSLAGL